MGLIEKTFGMGVLPFLLGLLMVMSLCRKNSLVEHIIRYITKVKFTLNGVTIYVFPMIALINVFLIHTFYNNLM